ncbi:MAG TPA: lipase chaperone, partial [Marinobacter sp.]|nr:lipase chaperone [Marinobacter sp.]
HHSVDDVRQALGQIHDLRREHLGPDVAEGFFGEEERRLQVMLDRQKILSDESLTASERDRALAQLDQLLPEYSRELRRRSRTVVETAMQVQQLREQGASEAEVRELRLQAYGAEATERLARLDQQRNQWQNRLGEYRQQKALIDNNEGLAPADRQAAVEALRERIFTEEHERRRIRALERTAGLDS